MNLTRSIAWVLLQGLVVLFTAKLVPGIRVKSYGTAVAVAIVYAAVTWLLKTVLVVISFPLIVLTFGLFLFAVNMFLLWLTDKLVSGFEIRGLPSLALGALSMSVGGMLVNWVLR